MEINFTARFRLTDAYKSLPVAESLPAQDELRLRVGIDLSGDPKHISKLPSHSLASVSPAVADGNADSDKDKEKQQADKPQPSDAPGSARGGLASARERQLLCSGNPQPQPQVVHVRAASGGWQPPKAAFGPSSS